MLRVITLTICFITIILILHVAVALPLSASSDKEASPLQTGNSCVLPYGVVVDNSLSSVFLTTNHNEIQAVNIDTGVRYWKAPISGLPFATIDQYLLVQMETKKNILELGVLSATTGKQLSRNQVILPSGVKPSIDQKPGARFSLNATKVDTELYLTWDYVEQTLRSIPNSDRSPSSVVHEQGTLKVVLGSDAEIEATTVPSTPGQPITEVPGTLTWQAGKFLVQIHDERSSTPVEHSIILQRSHVDTNLPLPQIVLTRGPTIAHYTSADHRYLSISKHIREPSDPWLKYRLEVYSLESGDMIGSYASHVSAGPFCVSGATLFHITQPFGRRQEGRWINEPMSLRAINLKSGHQIWSRPLRDTTPRQAPPPMR